MEYNDKEIKVFNGKTMPEKKELSFPAQNMMQIRGDHVAAMIVPKPRTIEIIEDAVMKEAKYAKDDFYWGWFVKNNRTKKKEWIEGGTIGLAQALYRAWTNCELKTDVSEIGNQWIFKSTFIDFESGETMTREHRVLKPIIAEGDKYDYDRKLDMKFQSWYSKNQRNTIFAMLPRWLKNKAIKAAKIASQNELKGTYKEKLEKALTYFLSRDIAEKEIFAYFDKERIEDFGIEDVARVCNIANQLYNGEINADEIRSQFQEDFENKQSPAKKEEPKIDSSKMEQATKPKPREEKKQDKPVEQKPANDFENNIKSLELRGIDENEVCAYFNVENLSELDEQQKKELVFNVTEIESERMDPAVFKKMAAERFEMAMEQKKDKK